MFAGRFPISLQGKIYDFIRFLCGSNIQAASTYKVNTISELFPFQVEIYARGYVFREILFLLSVYQEEWMDGLLHGTTFWVNCEVHPLLTPAIHYSDTLAQELVTRQLGHFLINSRWCFGIIRFLFRSGRYLDTEHNIPGGVWTWYRHLWSVSEQD